MLHRDRERADSFGADAGRYDRARPSYPPELVEALTSEGPERVLDVGCGTGIAARLLVARGCRVLGIEPEARMAEVAQQHGLDVELGTFEEWDAAGRRFDLLTAGQAWHWVDPVKGAAKAATVLRPGGRIGLFWNHGHPSAEMQRRFDTVYTRHAPELLTNSTTTGSMAHNPLTDLVNSLHVAGFHDSGTTFTFGHDREYTTREWLDLAPTHSDHAQLAPDRLRALLDALGTEIDRAGGRFVVHYDTALLTARLPPQARRG